MLSDIITIVNELKSYLAVNNIDQERHVNRFISRFDKETKLLQKRVHNIDDFIDIHQAQLLMIHDAFVGEFAKTFVKGAVSKQNLRGCHDRFFKVFNIKNPKRRFARVVTFLTTKFCKGITYFDTNSGIDAVPFYHRDASCGSSTRTATAKFVESPNEHKAVFVKNCYIERKIYDIIHTNTLHHQDVDHMYELRTIEQLFQRYHPNESIHVDVKYFADGVTPCCLTLYTTKDLLTDTEIYTKSATSDIVTCVKITHSGKVYEKTQTGAHEEAWVLQRS